VGTPDHLIQGGWAKAGSKELIAMATLVGLSGSQVQLDATERCPRATFDFDLGVLCRTWRAAYYSYGVQDTGRHLSIHLDTGGSEPESKEDRS
jgi:hypothetical protein